MFHDFSYLKLLLEIPFSNRGFFNCQKFGSRVLKFSPVFVSQVCSSLRLAWDCAVRLEAQLGEADRPWEQRNRWLQDIETVGSDLDLVKMPFPAKFNGIYIYIIYQENPQDRWVAEFEMVWRKCGGTEWGFDEHLFMQYFTV